MLVWIRSIWFIAGKKRHSRWSNTFRQQIVAEAEASDGPMSEVTRRHGVNPKLLYVWRQQFASVSAPAETGQEVCLVPVEVEASPAVPPEGNCASGLDCLEVTLPSGAHVRCGRSMPNRCSKPCKPGCRSN
ncbi:MAG: transposase [Kordiimonadaceae bacterium]|nr:transposase [Kordiimonadaceae bacterium]